MYKSLATLLFLSLFAFTELAANGDDLVGIWKPSNGRSILKVEKIGNKYYGRVVWLKEPTNEDGSPRTDINNPDESLQSTPLKGYRILKDLSYDEKEKVWTGGTIYDPNNGSTYNCTIEKKDDSTIEVRGYIGAALFGRTDVWTKMKKK